MNSCLLKLLHKCILTDDDSFISKPPSPPEEPPTPAGSWGSTSSATHGQMGSQSEDSVPDLLVLVADNRRQEEPQEVVLTPMGQYIVGRSAECSVQVCQNRRG